jgi:hypothetical protein
MVITRQMVSEKILGYLNRNLTLAELVDWAENSFIDSAIEPKTDTELLNDVLGYLAAADTSQFPLTWDTCADFMARLGTPVKVISTEPVG